MEQSCPQCQQAVTPDPGASSAACPRCGHRLTPASDTGASTVPELPSRYRLLAWLGVGGLAEVFRANDEELERDVAVKVIHARLLTSPRAVDLFLTEARILARLDHPGIMPVYDMGQTPDGRHFQVIKLFEGSDLQQRLREGRPPAAEVVEIVAQSAEALHYAHQHGLVHRDVKPGNLLLDGNTRIIVADFDLALRSEDFGTGPAFVGTIPYMSPEQARRESHRVDARSDVYSLGVVLYEALTGQRPFISPNRDELLELIKTQEPKPPRQIDDAICPELERISLKAMAKRVTDRYATARDLAEDLRRWQTRRTAPSDRPDSVPAEARPAVAAAIVPRGLRSFRVEDADFFLELLPGPRDRHGLPEAIAFWKAQLESTDPEKASPLGLLYGPSGCGKSSLVKAGLLPRLSPAVVAVYQEATPHQTESRLLKALRRSFPDLPPDLDLVQSMEALRRGRGLPAGKKAVLVLDQFEQWLHASSADRRSEMVEALRQCDGVHLQCLLLVRDDFWLAVSRFMREVEVRLVEDQNSTLVDLFDLPHARKVLTALGRAHGRLPADSALTAEQEQFLDQALAGMHEEGQVAPVRLALFAEIVKGKPWKPATLHAVGGAEGIGLAFLEDAFSSAAAPAEHRLREKPARAVLQALLPGAETSLKGRLHSVEELRSAAGYDNQPDDFADLLRILDQELRLVTPATEDEQADVQGLRYYQLTHDFLVPALRQWLSDKQRETPRGRAELRLADCAAFWNSRPENRRLPRWWEWVNIALFTRRRRWNDTERRLMRSANRYYTIVTTAALLLIAGAAAGALAIRHRFEEAQQVAHADRLVGDISNFHENKLAHFQLEALGNHQWTLPRLRDLIDDPQTERDDRLHARLVLLAMDPGQARFLEEALDSAEPQEVLEIRAALLPYGGQVKERLWAKARETDGDRRFRAAAALALFAPDDPRWTEIAPRVVEQLVTENPVLLTRWLEAFRPVRARLLPALNQAFRKPHDVRQRVAAVHILKDYVGDQPDVLTELLLDAGDLQYALLWPTIQANASAIADRLRRYLKQPPAVGETALARAGRDRRQAVAAATLLYMNPDQPLASLLDRDSGPDLRSWLIHLYRPSGADAQALYRIWEQERDRSIQLGLLFELGEYPLTTLPADLRPPLLDQLLELYRGDPDPGSHSALDWLLRHTWGLDDKLEPLDRVLAGVRPPERRWFINSQQQTFAVLPGPIEFFRGLPTGEPLRRERLPRSFAIATRPVTLEQFDNFRQAHPGAVSTELADVKAGLVGISWYEAARYCRWLSEQEGVAEDQMVYPPIEQIKPGMTLPADCLNRTGYRLPTESEWEYACLSGPRFPRSADDQLLGHYAWYFASYQARTATVDRRKPNGFGLFGVHRGVGEWCQESFGGGVEPVSDSAERVVRGCFAPLPAGLSGSNYRSGLKPGERHTFVGLRLARTVRAN